MNPVIEVRFPGNLRVEADFGDRVVATDQKRQNDGDESAPEPYQLFLASIATCAGYYVLRFCRSRDLSTEGIVIRQRHEFREPGHVLSEVRIDIAVPPGFPAKYHDALVRAVDGCAVKKSIGAGPTFAVTASAGRP